MPCGRLKLMVSEREREKRTLNFSANLMNILGLYGSLFRRNKEAAFSNYRLWESLGFVVAYAYSTAICAKMKLYIVITVLAVGTICYIAVEIRQLRKVSSQKKIPKNSNF